MPRQLPKAMNTPLLDPTLEKRNLYLIQKELLSFTKSAQAKYRAGRVKHHNDPTTIDYEKEIDQEIMDLVIYRIMKRLFAKGK